MTVWTRIIGAIGPAQGPERAAGRTLLLECWVSTSEDNHAQRCVLAHYLADTESDLDAEIARDERALMEHPFVRGVDLAPLGIAAAAVFIASLELFVAEGHHRRGNLTAACRHLERGRAVAATLPDDGYGTMIRGRLDALGQRLSESASNSG